MKIAILSDVHSNIHALMAVWDDFEYIQPDETYCLGYLVGHGAYPNETIDFVTKNNISRVMGNYDDAVGFDRESCGCARKNPANVTLSNYSLYWTKQYTSGDNKTFLRGFPTSIRKKRCGHRLLFVNTGLVGNPEDGDSRAGYVLLTLKIGKANVYYSRADYNVSAAAQAVRMNGLPEQFASQLKTGGRKALVPA